MDQDKKRCQSCGMPLTSIGLYGTDKDGTPSVDYCQFCFRKGEFVDPDITQAQMIASTTSYMIKGLKMPEVQAREISSLLIPRLKRWNKN